MSAIEKYRRRVREADSLLCLGLDSLPQNVPPRYRHHEFPLFEFHRELLAAGGDMLCAVKPNMAFYEAQGAQGLQELRLTLDWLREHQPRLLTICDAKRGDIGTSSAAYARAIFDLLEFDAVTLNPWLGRDALQPFLEREERVCVILCRTSNPGAGEFQDLSSGGRALWEHVAETVSSAWNSAGNCMLVMGATAPRELARARAIIGDMPMLVPGIGAQGGAIAATLRAGLTSAGDGLILNVARGILQAPGPLAAMRSLCEELRRERAQLAG